MRKVTLCFLLKDDEILLAVKKRSLSGFGAGIGKWNGIGGKVDKGEMIRFATTRELNEEVGVVVKEDDLEEVGNIKFYYPEHCLPLVLAGKKIEGEFNFNEDGSKFDKFEVREI